MADEKEVTVKKEKPVKPLEAKVKPQYFMNSIIAFSGKVFNKTNWNPVPAGQEENARTHEWLEVREYNFKTSEKEREAGNRGEVIAEPVEVKEKEVKDKPTFAHKDKK